MGVPDHGPMIGGVTWWLTVFCGGFLGLRIYAKLSRKQLLWWDDHILIVSWILLLAEAVILQVGIILGFGRPGSTLPIENLPKISMCFSVMATVACFASTLSKISFGVTLLRLTTGHLSRFIWFCIISLVLVNIPSALSLWFGCGFLNTETWCWKANVTVNYGYFNAAWCAAADFALALLPWYLIWGLQLKLKHKIGLGIAMSTGVLAGICAIVKGIYLIQLREQDFSYNGKEAVLWTIVETAAAIIAASIPVLRVFFKERVFASYSQYSARSTTHTQSQCPKDFLPLSRLNRNQGSVITKTTVQAISQEKDGSWTIMEDACQYDGASQWGMSQWRVVLDDEENTLERGDAGVYMQSCSFSVAVRGSDGESYKTRSWLDMP
ncbi:hypothetical protein EJ02DRAFT_29331 [Clathrospora elynae]|uniref:Rhodopsin domain-containing protein n=1 Tax=Clathrospora elynae TaxID=706981 RepID=A0A6A5SFT0_9PLEO|nr:hypothetical protein EJ02DRAFT_29331 [Clathrospora elynae]